MDSTKVQPYCIILLINQTNERITTPSTQQEQPYTIIHKGKRKIRWNHTQNNTPIMFNEQ